MFTGCGIAGALSFDRTGPRLADLRQVVGALAHRGPDAEGFWQQDNVMLGHRRLSIIGLAESGTQPMVRDHLAITYNGELYNYRKLRSELSRDFVFTSDTDTEVILRAWQRWGRAAVDRFDGMFAFALWNSASRSLTLVRDRLGVKPLYLHRSASALMFASEVEALLRFPGVPREPDVDALRHRLLCSSTLEPDQSRTVVRQVEALPPATIMTVSADGTTRSAMYWALPDTAGSAEHPDPAVELRLLLGDAVESMLVSDVPVAAFLSGGLDSSAITALAAGRQRMPAVTVAHPSAARSREGLSGDSDLRYSEALARHLGERVDHRTVLQTADVSLADIDAVCDLASLADDVRHVGILANYRSIRDMGLKVVLNGQGADELMGGYVGRPNFVANIVDVLAPDEKTVRRLPASRQAGFLSADVLRYRRTADERVLDYLAGLTGGAVERVHRLLVHTQLLRVVQFEDFLAMRVTVEARFPFLDHRVAEWCFSRPFDMHIETTKRRGKSVLRAAMNGVLPQELLQRRKEVFPYPDSVRLHAALTALATEHEPELRSDPLVASMFQLPEKGRMDTVDTDSLWLFLSVWRWHKRLTNAHSAGSATLVGAERLP